MPDPVGTWAIITLPSSSPPIGSIKDCSTFMGEQNWLKFTFMWFLAPSILFTMDILNGGRTSGFHILQRFSESAVSLLKLEVFENACVPDVPKSTRCRIMRSVAKCGNPEIRPPLKNIQVKKRLEWEQKIYLYIILAHSVQTIDNIWWHDHIIIIFQFLPLFLGTRFLYPN